jgi:hypothetical protein
VNLKFGYSGLTEAIDTKSRRNETYFITKFPKCATKDLNFSRLKRKILNAKQTLCQTRLLYCD